jgi:hypothetical protein
MTKPAHAPGVAHQAAKAELWLRDADGRALRPVRIDQARQLIAAGAAYPIVGADGNWREVRLNTSLPPNSRYTFIEHRPAAAGSHGARFEHNHRACNLWKH